VSEETWDVIVVGGGHNGLTAAAYLARAGRSVLVVERRERLGGACTLERPFGDQRAVVSPCAYLVGLLDPGVVAELDLHRHGYRVTLADPNLWCPLPDGRTVAQYADPARTAAHLRGQGFSVRDIEGVVAYEELFDRLRRTLRRRGADTWSGPSPSRDELVELVGEDASVLFEDSVADVLARYVSDEGLQAALCGQGVIGTMAGPRDAGTASIHLMHSMGEVEGVGGAWGYVEGGMGRVSMAIAAAAQEAGATLAVSSPVASVLPGEGVVLESGERLLARTVISNADPKRLLGLLDPDDVPTAFAARVAEWRTDSPVVKLNAMLGRLPTWTAAAAGERPERAMISITAGVDGMQAAADRCRAGEAAVGFCELYFHTAYDPSIAPPGKHMMSVFAQYAPHGGDAVRDLVLDTIAEHAPDVRECIEELEVLGPPDIEERIGLTGGHIFQGEALPDQMWDRRFGPRTGIDGVYLCGAATHPGGSVIALNGRNAAMAVLEDLG
jgi:phytoene dehydrogenase-like protein